MPDPSIPLSEYAARRRKLLAALRKSVGVVFAGELSDPLHDTYHAHPHFHYLTGIIDEPGAVLVLDPGATAESRRELLFLRSLNPELEKWDGLRMEISQALREGAGFKAIFRVPALPRFLTEAVKRSRSMACLHPLANYEAPVSPDLAIFRRIAERIPGAEIEDRTIEMARLRSVKSRAEIAMISRAIDVTPQGFETVFARLGDAATEFDVQEMLEHAYRTAGSRGPSFGTIVGSGINSTVLHYRANDQPLEQGDLVCIDTGAGYGGYGADITRTVPVSGSFTKRQREVYETVLKAENAAIRAAKPGVRITQIDRVARAIINKAGYGDYFIHGIGHHLGLETHDIDPDAPLKPGAVITIEPGIYIPGEKIGIRIEDDILITKDGSRNLSNAIPKTAAAIEKAMAKRSR